MTREQFLTKYGAAVARISEKNNVDLGVAGDMFIADVKQLKTAKEKAGKNWYAGLGTINVDQAVEDLDAYIAALPKAKGIFRK